MKTKFLLLVVSVCMIAVPAKASMFDFHFGSLDSSFDGTSGFITSTNPTLTSGSVTRQRVPQAVANFLADGLLPGIGRSTLRPRHRGATAASAFRADLHGRITARGLIAFKQT